MVKIKVTGKRMFGYGVAIRNGQAYYWQVGDLGPEIWQDINDEDIPVTDEELLEELKEAIWRWIRRK